MKTEKELRELKAELEAVDLKLRELTEAELDFVSGGLDCTIRPREGSYWMSWNPNAVSDEHDDMIIP